MSQGELNEKNEQLLADISQLQEIETSLYNKLASPNNTLTPQETETTIIQINQLSSMRINLWQFLNTANGLYTNNLSNASTTLEQQTKALLITETELNEAKKRLEYVSNQTTEKFRQVEINNYYTGWYSERTTLMKIVFFTILVVLILVILQKRNILPNGVISILSVILVLVSLYFIIPLTVSILMRNNMNYDEYNFAFDKNSAPTISGGTDATNPWASTITSGSMCTGQACCASGNVYDASLNICVVAYNTTTDTSTTVPPPTTTTTTTTTPTTTTTTTGM